MKKNNPENRVAVSPVIRRVLSGASNADIEWLFLHISVTRSIRQLAAETGESPKQVCERYNIPLSKYESFIRGGIEHSLDTLAITNAWALTVAMDRSTSADVRLEELKAPASSGEKLPKRRKHRGG